ncbi:hypothetical protein SAMN05443575_0156 [Jatrophihabitans endophyticus]|uniref:EcsC protein family protein n=1 Tax=Jatrophihabitans endophyticus TaxID=1206085 RepID=A0A1M5C9J1_9ACTN|nr:hypothetical protein SAMN05443575_0156 [Jatrophihabitans endophyticus]
MAKKQKMSTRLLSRVPVPARVERALDDALDKGLAVQRPVVQRYLARVRSKNPELSPAETISLLERRYRAAVVGIGGASGAAAAVPGIGTAAGLATGAAEITGFFSATAMYVLALAELHSVPIGDPEVRRALVIGVLVGEGAERVIAGTATDSGHWAQMIGRATAKDTGEKAGVLQSRLLRMLVTRAGARQGALVLGRALPLGIGAGVGAVGNAALARGVVASARRAFGPAPATFPGLVIDADPPGRKN